MAIEQFKLTQTEKQSALWEKIEAHFKERIDILRKRNDDDADEKRTAETRATIRECKYMLSLASIKTSADDE